MTLAKDSRKTLFRRDYSNEVCRKRKRNGSPSNTTRTMEIYSLEQSGDQWMDGKLPRPEEFLPDYITGILGLKAGQGEKIWHVCVFVCVYVFVCCVCVEADLTSKIPETEIWMCVCVCMCKLI